MLARFDGKDPRARLVAECGVKYVGLRVLRSRCKKEGNFAKDCKKAKVKDYNYYETKILLAKKDSDEQVLLAEDQAWIESSSDFDQKINANMVFMAQIEKVLSDLDESSSSAKETIIEAFPLPGESSHWQYKFPLPVEGVPTTRRMKIPLPGVCTAMMKKLPVKDRWQLH
nr:hypothetical protein [Tanacetum cinerariifolium]